MNFELKVKEVLKETFILTGKINNEELIKNLIEVVKNNKDENIGQKTHVKGHFTGFKTLIQNKDFLNFLKIIHPQIKIVYGNDFQILDAWGNLCKINEEITEHSHLGITGFCGILYLTEGGPGTYFREYDFLVEEEIGKYVLFHPSLLHSVEKIKNNLERITVAFNMVELKKWNDYSKAIKVNKNDI
jgi:hypothetical protein